MEEVIEFDTGPYRNRPVTKPTESPQGYEWFCLPPPKRPSELSPPLVWEPLVDVADRLGIARNTLRRRVALGSLTAQHRKVMRYGKLTDTLYILASEVEPPRSVSPKGQRKPPVSRAAGHDGRAVRPTKGDCATVAERVNHGATNLGISPEIYMLHKEQGESWCSRHRAWEPLAGFDSVKVRGAMRPQTSCRVGKLEYNKEYYQRKKKQNRAG